MSVHGAGDLDPDSIVGDPGIGGLRVLDIGRRTLTEDPGGVFDLALGDRLDLVREIHVRSVHPNVHSTLLSETTKGTASRDALRQIGRSLLLACRTRPRTHHTCWRGSAEECRHRQSTSQSTDSFLGDHHTHAGQHVKRPTALSNRVPAAGRGGVGETDLREHRCRHLQRGTRGHDIVHECRTRRHPAP